jgi:hypothetical protein
VRNEFERLKKEERVKKRRKRRGWERVRLEEGEGKRGGKSQYSYCRTNQK